MSKTRYSHLDNNEIAFLKEELRGSYLSIIHQDDVFNALKGAFKEKFSKDLELNNLEDLYEMFEIISLDECEICNLLFQVEDREFNNNGDTCCGGCYSG